PNAAAAVNRKPAWNAARLLGYTDPIANLAPGGLPITSLLPGAATKAPGLTVWPGRKMLWASANGTNVPMTRTDFLPDDCATYPCNPLITALGLNPASATDKTKAKLIVQFLRGGKTAYGSRDEILNDPTVKPATLVPATIGPGTGQNQKYSYFFQDDTPPPGLAPQVRTDAGTPPGVPNGYPHKLGDIFHSEAAVVDPPRFFPYLSLNLPGYGAFVDKYAKRRRVILVGSNDGFLHAFDTGVWNRDTVNYNNAFDLGTGREIFAFSPPDIISGFPSVLALPPPAKPPYFVDGSMGVADAFVDTAHGGTPVPANRNWRTLVVGGLRQGGAAYYALDVTQPDDIDAAGLMIGNKDAAPGCLNGGPASCSGKKYPEVLWTLTDTTVPKMGETWSRPVLGRIKIINGVGF
ncbi:MAG TPA: PilC/PilY family type IV pilus protein, partial [Thermoanaerobaculia bacterium]|nr:PilC/PilY family type IV pilus protein [Thermoanaerobaculia bacterium]